MSDPFQTRQAAKSASASHAAPALRDTASAKSAQEEPAGLLRPRDPRIGRAIKLLDVLTSGDEALLAYLKEHGAQALQAVEDAKADMAEAETPEEAEDFRPDPMDELVAQMAVVAEVVEAPAPAGSSGGQSSADTSALDLQSLRDALMAECQSAITALALPQANPVAGNQDPIGELSLIDDDMLSGWRRLGTPPVPQLLLATCTIPGCCIHSVTPNGGDIIHHYEPSELNTPALRLADHLLHCSPEPDYVEVYGDSCVVAVDSRGMPTKHTA